MDFVLKASAEQNTLKFFKHIFTTLIGFLTVLLYFFYRKVRSQIINSSSQNVDHLIFTKEKLKALII